MTYIIKDWDKIYENAHSRKVENARWLPLPNKHDGKGFRRIALREDRCEIFSAFVLLAEVVSQCPKKYRLKGMLRDEDGDLDFEDMELKTGFPQDLFKRALPVLMKKKIGWVVDSSTVESNSSTVERVGLGQSNEGKKEGKKERKSAGADSQNLGDSESPSGLPENYDALKEKAGLK